MKLPSALAFAFAGLHPVSPASALESNPPESPQLLPGPCSASQGRRSKCEVELDVPPACVSADATSSCPVVFFFHGAGGSNDGFARNSGVHSAGVVGVYPQGEDGWNTGPKTSNSCAWDDFDCASDPDEGAFVASIVSELRDLGASGNVYLIGNSNGAALAHRLAANAGDDLPIKGVVAKVTQLLADPPRSGPGALNYNQPLAGGPAVSILNLMGTDDGVIPYNGGSSPVFGGDPAFSLMTALESMEAWAAHNGCAEGDVTIDSNVSYGTDADPGGAATFYEYGSCPEGVIVEHYALIGAGHSFGSGAALNGVTIDHDLAYQFISRLEGNGGGGGGGGGGDGPCEDDPNWHGKFNVAHACAYVAESPEARCGWENSDSVPASEACKVACGQCDPVSTPAPTNAVTPAPTDAVTPAPTPPPTATTSCVDDPAWHGKFNAAHTCAYVAESPTARCGWEDGEGVQASEACQVACGRCDAASTPAPTPAVTPDPTDAATLAPTPPPTATTCVDDPNWHGKFNVDHTCSYVAESPLARCGWESSDGTLASDACAVSCGTC
ncbi:hypothetical protein ACHAWF_004439 [Thalassiosira exigua]